MRSIVTSMNGLTRCRSSVGSGMKSTSRVVLSTRVAHGRAQHPGPGDRPERTGEEDQRGADAEADGQQQKRDSNPGGPVDAADERDLNDESRDRQIGGDLGQECRDAVAAAVPAQRFGRHVQLLIDDGGGARRGAPDRKGQHLQRARFGKQRYGLPAADALLGCVELGLLAHAVAAEQEQHDPGTGGQRDRADQHELFGAHLLDDGRGQAGPPGRRRDSRRRR